MNDNPLTAATPLQVQTLIVLQEAGWLYKAAAARLDVPETTVRSRVHNLLRRTKLQTRADAAYWLGRWHAN